MFSRARGAASFGAVASAKGRCAALAFCTTAGAETLAWLRRQGKALTSCSMWVSEMGHGTG